MSQPCRSLATSDDTRRILVVGGNSGGHIFPALAFLTALKDRSQNIETILVLPRKGIEDPLICQGHRVCYLSVSPIRLGLGFKNLASLFNLLKSFSESIFIISDFKPEVAVGFGSLACIPVILVSWLFRINTVIHEQNIFPGRANRLLAIFADKIALSFKETEGYLKNYSNKLVVTGNPLRSQLKIHDKDKALEFFGLESGKITILVMGGSQGSHRINSNFPDAISALDAGDRLQILHISGERECDLVRGRYRGLKIRLFSFLREMEYAYSACDFTICRAGATTIAELIYFSLPAILVPYPFAYKHQMFNAGFLESKGAAIVIKDEDLEAVTLRRVIGSLLDDRRKIDAMRSCYNKIPKGDAAYSLVTEALDLK